MRDCLRLTGRRTTRDLGSVTGDTATTRRREATPTSPNSAFLTSPETEPVRCSTTCGSKYAGPCATSAS